MADTDCSRVQDDESSSQKNSTSGWRPAMLLDLWTSSDDEDHVNDIHSHDLAPDTPSSESLSQAKPPLTSQLRNQPLLNDTKCVVHQPDGELDSFRMKGTNQPLSKNSLSLALPFSRTNKYAGNLKRSAESVTSNQSAKRNSPTFFPRRRKTVLPVLHLPRKTCPRIPTTVISDSSTEEESDIESGATTVTKSNLHSKGPRRQQLKSTDNRVMFVRSSSSSSSSSDSELGATSAMDSYSYSRANIGWQPGNKQTNSKSSRVIVHVGSSSSSSSNSSDSESLLSPSKLKQAQTHRMSTTTVPQKQSRSYARSQRFPSGHKPVANLGQPGGCKRVLSKDTNHIPRYKRVRLSPTFGSVTSHSSSDDETSLGPGLSSAKSRKRYLKSGDRSRKTIETGNPLDNVSPEKVSQQKIIDLFGQSSSDDSGELTEDTQEVKEGQEDVMNTKKMSKTVSRTSDTSTKRVTPIPVDCGSSDYLSDGVPWLKNKALFPTHDASVTTHKKVGSERDGSVVLIDITQSAERGAMSGQSSPKLNLTSSTRQLDNKSLERLPPVFPQSSHSHKELAVGKNEIRQQLDSKGIERMSPVFPANSDTYKELAVRCNDDGSNIESVIVGDVDGSEDFKNAQVDSKSTSKDSHLVFRPWQKDSQCTTWVNSGRPHLNKQPPNPKEKISSQDYSQCKSQSTVFGTSSVVDVDSGRVQRHAELISTVNQSREGSSEAMPSNPSQRQRSATATQDEFRFPVLSFEENRLRWLEESQGSVLNKTTIASQLPSSSVTIFKKRFFSNSQSRGEPSQSSATGDKTGSSFEDRQRWSEQMRGSLDSESGPESPVFSRSSHIHTRRNLAARESRDEPTQSIDSRNATNLSIEGDHLQWSEHMMEDCESVSNSLFSALEKRKGTKKHDQGNRMKRSQLPKSSFDIHVAGGSSLGTDKSRSHVALAHHGDIKHRNQGSRRHSRNDDRCLLSAHAGQVHSVQNIGPDAKEKEGQATRQRADSKTQSTVKGSSRDLEVPDSQSSKNSSVLSLKARRKSRHDVEDTGKHSARRGRDCYILDSPAITRIARISQQDSQGVESRNSRHSSPGGFSGRTNRREEEISSEIPVLTDSDIAELVRQLDEDERMAKELQEHFDAELARLTQQHNEIMADVPPVEPLSPIPTLPYPPVFCPGARPSSVQILPGARREMTWRDDLVDMNPLNAAMMAEMGRLVDSREIQAGYGQPGRQRQSRVRGRGRSRGRGRHHNHMHHPVADGSDYEALWNLSERVGQAVSKGLPESSISLLPTFLYTSGKDASEIECSICMGEYEAGENMRRLPCFHFYHAACIDKWLKDNRICPVCREEVNFDPVNFT